MIIVQLLGGLGNQLFQYATARRLSYRLQTELKLDITPFETYKLHKYSLQHFAIVANFASAAEIAALSRTGLARKGIRAVDKFRLPLRFSHVIERSLRFDPGILHLHDNVYLEGYWQSERYFKDITTMLRTELCITTPPSAENESLAARIAAVPAVSLHIRRADYASNPTTLQRHGLTSLEYYKQAVRFIAERITTPHFFVFSDDPAWVQANLETGFPTTFVTHNNADTNYEDLRLMSLCRHHIIANSSFSWWSAWLNPTPQKIVIAPARWANDSALNTSDRIPPEWHRI
jgi:hypothetical protein